MHTNTSTPTNNQRYQRSGDKPDLRVYYAEFHAESTGGFRSLRFQVLHSQNREIAPTIAFNHLFDSQGLGIP
jgi:hypothetical protein